MGFDRVRVQKLLSRKKTTGVFLRQVTNQRIWVQYKRDQQGLKGVRLATKEDRIAVVGRVGGR